MDNSVTTDEKPRKTAWQPIETAPTDGTPILVHAAADGFYTQAGDIGIVCWRPEDGFGDPNHWVARWCCDQVTTFVPDFWQPVPTPPYTQKEPKE